MDARKTTSRLVREISAAVEAFDPDDDDVDIGEWIRDNLLPLLESTALAVDEVAKETAAGFAEIADVIAEVLEAVDDDDDDEGYLIPFEITQGAGEILNLAADIIVALRDSGAPSDETHAKIAAFDTGAKALLEKMAELTEDEEDNNDDDDEATEAEVDEGTED